MHGSGADGDEPAHAVTDHHRKAVDPPGPGDGDDLLGPLLEGVGLAMPAVAVAGQVEREHPELPGEGRGHMGPPMGVGTAAVDEDQSPPPRLTPGQVVDGYAADLHPLVGGGHGQCPAKPLRTGGLHRVGLRASWFLDGHEPHGTGQPCVVQGVPAGSSTHVPAAAAPVGYAGGCGSRRPHLCVSASTEVHQLLQVGQTNGRRVTFSPWQKHRGRATPAASSTRSAPASAPPSRSSRRPSRRSRPPT